MSESKEFTYQDVSAHTTKKDLYVVIHDKVYDVSSFVDEHPGGEEVMLDVGGQDATEAFEDVGHSEEAREILAGYEIGTLIRKPGDPVPSPSRPQDSPVSSPAPTAGTGIGLYAIIFGVAIAYAIYQYLQTSSQGKQ
ncbi:Cytochrome b5-like heme/steroid binding domain containing protein [Elaphomyces granulatus]|jgi:cytochrome b involved in lipid metabolism